MIYPRKAMKKKFSAPAEFRHGEMVLIRPFYGMPDEAAILTKTMKNLRKIEVNFPVEVDMTADEQRLIDRVVRSICLRYEKQHPDRVLWGCGIGQKPIWSHGDIDGFEASTFCIDCSTRPRYESEKGYPDPDAKRGPVTTVGDLLAALCNMPLEAGVYVSGVKLTEAQVATIASVSLVQVQELPVGDPLNLTVQVELALKA